MKKRKVSEENVVVNGVTFSKDMKVLIKYPKEKKDSFYHVPKSVETIKEGAFYGCRHLTDIFIPDAVERIEFGAFYGCNNLKNIMVGTYNNAYTSKGGQLYDVQKDKNIMDEVFLPDINYIIPEEKNEINGFENYCMEDEEVGYRYFSIGDNYIEVFGTVRSVTIPRRVARITKNPFSTFKKAERFEVDENNAHFKSIDGVLFSKDGKHLIAYPIAKTDKEYTVPDSVEVIGEKAFAYCTHLEKINLPDSIRSIGRYAFKETSLKDFILPKKVTKIFRGTFEDCSVLRNVVLHTNLKVIDDDAFFGSALSEVNIPDSVKIIGEAAFAYCNLSSIRLGSNISSILERTFYGNLLEEVDIGQGVTYIGEEAFGQNNMKKIVIPDNVKTIEDQAFVNCYALEEVYIGSGVLNIRSFPFPFDGCLARFEVSKDNPKYCSIDGVLLNKNTSFTVMIPPKAKLPNRAIKEVDGVFFNGNTLEIYPENKLDTSYNIPEWCKDIVPGAFHDCTCLEEVIIPGSLSRIYSEAFEGCHSLKKVTILEGVTQIGLSVFKNCSNLAQVILPSSIESIHEEAFKNCEKLKSIELPDGLEWIGDEIFTGCQSLKSIHIPGTVRVVPESAFAGCRNLKSVIIGNGVITIGKGAFTGCENLQTISIPESVGIIAEKAFCGCRKLKRLILPNTIKINEGIADGCESLTEIAHADGQPLVNPLDGDFFDNFDIPF